MSWARVMRSRLPDFLAQRLCLHYSTETIWAYCPSEKRYRPLTTECLSCGKVNHHKRS